MGEGGEGGRGLHGMVIWLGRAECARCVMAILAEFMDCGLEGSDI